MEIRSYYMDDWFDDGDVRQNHSYGSEIQTASLHLLHLSFAKWVSYRKKSKFSIEYTWKFLRDFAFKFASHLLPDFRLWRRVNFGRVGSQQRVSPPVLCIYSWSAPVLIGAPPTPDVGPKRKFEK